MTDLGQIAGTTDWRQWQQYHADFLPVSQTDSFFFLCHHVLLNEVLLTEKRRKINKEAANGLKKNLTCDWSVHYKSFYVENENWTCRDFGHLGKNLSVWRNMDAFVMAKYQNLSPFQDTRSDPFYLMRPFWNGCCKKPDLLMFLIYVICKVKFRKK